MRHAPALPRSAARLTVVALIASLSALGALAACKEVTVPNYNSPNVDQLTDAPNASTLNTTVLGLLVGSRATVGTYATGLGILGRAAARRRARGGAGNLRRRPAHRRRHLLRTG